MGRTNRLILLATLLVLLVALCGNGFAYDIEYDSDSATDIGAAPVLYDNACVASTSTRWKSIRYQATATATATHFAVKVGAALGSVPFGFAVYAGSDNVDDPITTLLGRGYYASHNFSAAGWYAFPFTSVSGVSITSGNYYHLVFLLTPGDEAATSACRATDPPHPKKWGSACSGSECNADMPPLVGTETWNIEYDYSASWMQGLIAIGSSASTVVGISIIGGSFR